MRFGCAAQVDPHTLLPRLVRVAWFCGSRPLLRVAVDLPTTFTSVGTLTLMFGRNATRRTGIVLPARIARLPTRSLRGRYVLPFVAHLHCAVHARTHRLPRTSAFVQFPLYIALILPCLHISLHVAQAATHTRTAAVAFAPSPAVAYDLRLPTTCVLLFAIRLRLYICIVYPFYTYLSRTFTCPYHCCVSSCCCNVCTAHLFTRSSFAYIFVCSNVYSATG